MVTSFFFRTTLYGFYLTIRDSHERCGSILTKYLPYTKFRWSWYGFFGLLCKSIDFTKGFSCPDCKGNPTKLIMDATSLAHRKKHTSWNDYLREHMGDPDVLDTKRYSDRS